MLTNPEVLVADPEMIKQITIKEFDKFPDRQIFQGIGGTQIQGKTYRGLLIAMGKEWKERRQILSPAFTASKMKLVSAGVWRMQTTTNCFLLPPLLFLTHSLYLRARWSP